MAKTKTPTFIHELKLKTNAYQNRKLGIKFRALRELYNTQLAACMKVFRAMKKDQIYKQNIEDYLSNKKLEKIKDPVIKQQFLKEQQRIFDIFSQLNKKYGFDKFEFQKSANEIKKTTYMNDHLDSATVQVISDRAFQAVADWRYGLRGKPRFKTWQEGLRSISGKQNVCIVFKNGKVKWKDLTLDVIYDKNDKHGIEAHALNCDVKYCRIISRKIKGKIQYYVQLSLEGTPKQKFVAPEKMVGIDAGVSTVASVSEDKAILEPFCLELDNIQEEIKKKQRILARSLRLNNPDNYDEKGAIKKGKKVWKKSNNYIELNNELLELHRKQRDKRQYLHNVLANDILRLGCHIKIEKNNYKAWQKGWFGKTLAFRAPSNFENTLKRKALSAGGQWYEINSFQAKLSQFCHKCGQYHKKALSDRFHECCELHVQRDLYSATLAYYINEKNQVNVDQLKRNWSGVDTFLNSAILNLKNKLDRLGKGQILPTSLGIKAKVFISESESLH